MITKYKSVLMCIALIFAVSFGVPSLGQTCGDQDTETSENASSDGPASGAASDLATKLANPIANMISVPFQFNWDTGLGADRNHKQPFQLISPVVTSRNRHR